MTVRFRSAAACVLMILLSACTTHPVRPSGGHFVARSVAAPDGSIRRYRVFVPTREAGGAQPPIILFLHGSGERGSDGVKPTEAGLGPYVQDHADAFPAIVVFPQVPEDDEWYGDNAITAFAALDAATREFGADPSRTYLTGISMGGYGVWELALMQPQRFAALVPVCGAIKRVHDERALFVTQVVDEPDPYSVVAQRLKDVPVWIFHGAKDDVVPLRDDRALIKAYRAIQAPDARYTELPEANHNAWDPTYAETPALWTWLFAQRRR